MKIAVPRTAPMILFHSKESMALPKSSAKAGGRSPGEIRRDITRRRPRVIAAKRRINL